MSSEVIQQTIVAKHNDHVPLDNNHIPLDNDLDNDHVPLDNGFNDISHNAAVDHPIHTHFEDEDHLLPSSLQMHSFAQQNTPSARTGPPRSLSFAYSLPNSPSRNNSKGVDYLDIPPDSSYDEAYPFSSTNSDFRGALEYIDRKGKRRESRFIDESWNPRRWFHESPKEEKSAMDFPSPDAEEKKPIPAQSDKDDDERRSQHSPSRRVSVRNDSGPPLSTSKSRSALRRAFSTSTTSQPTSPDANKDGKARWARLRALLPHIDHPDESILPGPSAVTSQAVNITDELMGGLSTLMLRLWFERDEKGQRRVPTLLHRLRIRVSDSLHPMHDHKSIFRIECEYANGAARWVIYRELRDFLSLHAHYAVSNVFNRNVDGMPEFPRTSLPYFKFLKKEGREKGDIVGKADFARLQREALENYLIELIRGVMFHPSANRLAGFLEISALSIALAQSGGAQYKAGYLKLEATGNGGSGFGRKSTSWHAQKESRWCAVRESYLVVLEQLGELTVHDVFFFDSGFKIERPTRYYRQNLVNLLNHSSDPKPEGKDKDHTSRPQNFQNYLDPPEDEHRSIISSIKTGVSKIFHVEPRSSKNSHEQPRRHGRVRIGHEHTQGDNTSIASTVSSSIASTVPSRAPTPMLDPSTNGDPLTTNAYDGDDEEAQQKWKDGYKAVSKAVSRTDVSKHTFYIVNSQVRLKLIAKNERQMLQFITALEKATSKCHFTDTHRFDSFSPIRLNVAAQWLVDGRDYFWNLSRAILLAKETIYIHDWWLSPELQMRRPNKDKYRLDRLLERKAKEGVMVYIILYQEVSNRTTPIDSNYAKQRLSSLHPNVMVQRSPSHFQTGTFYWAHHEKLCVIDQVIAFMGGLDLCFGRWDTPQHVLTDDVADTERSEIWPGKDYSNPAVSDFHTLNKPEEDMYDRTKTARMPWHDVGMQIVGQPARDLARHFVQRWNYLLRIKNHSRVMPFLLPPPEFRPGELIQMGLTGTCELQICRSAGPWSLGTPGKIESSIQNAYLKAIQMSEHFVYMENQFFITSTVVDDVKVENHIGDALVQRIIRAHRDHTPWKCCILIPLLPGFAFPVDHSDASAIRIILECQNRTIARGPNSIFGRLRKEGIDPDDYISVFSLRNWAKMRGDVLTTEQVYIHGKVCIVDDRLAIIGSANVNERSQRGDRDSELAAVIRDTDMLDCTMAGKPFKAGRFAHTLRVRLMREHLGVDVDALDEEDLLMNGSSMAESHKEPWSANADKMHGRGSTVPSASGSLVGEAKLAHDYDAQGAGDNADAPRKDHNSIATSSKASNVTLEEKTVAEHHHQVDILIDGGHDVQHQTIKEELEIPSRTLTPLPTDDGVSRDALANAKTDTPVDGLPPRHSDVDEEKAISAVRSTLRKNAGSKYTPWTVPLPRPKVNAKDFEDPISNAFWKDTWVASAVHNTEIYRKVFHAIPDDLVTTWKQYKDFMVHHERLNKPTNEELGDEGQPATDVSKEYADESCPESVPSRSSATPGESKPRKHAKGNEPFEKWERNEMENLLGELNGHLVLYPNRFLEGEDSANNFLFNADRLLPLPIYN